MYFITNVQVLSRMLFENLNDQYQRAANDYR